LQSKHGFEKVETPVFPVPDKVFFMDEHLEDVLVFPSSTSWWTGDLWYESGAVILQDKASCFPAKVLMEGWEESEGDCLDATYVSIPSDSEILMNRAAPGNKTSYISALMGNAGKVHAFERSEGRYKTLEKMLGRAGCSNVTPRRADFLDSKPNDKEFAKVTRMYVFIH
jgi:putative methyltransferase